MALGIECNLSRAQQEQSEMGEAENLSAKHL